MKKIAMTAALLIAAASQADVATLYTDDFSGLVGEALNGTAPDSRPGTETWVCRQSTPTLNLRDPRANGKMNGGASGAVAAGLGFSLVTGKVYTFSVDMQITNPENDGDDGVASATKETHWAGISFSTGTSVDSVALGENFASLLMRRNGGAQLLSPSGTATDEIDAGTYTYASFEEVSIILDTTESVWTADYLINGASIGEHDLDATLSAGTAYIRIGQASTTTVMFDNLSLTTIPEPATAGLFGVFVVVALLVRRFQL